MHTGAISIFLTEDAQIGGSENPSLQGLMQSLERNKIVNEVFLSAPIFSHKKYIKHVLYFGY